MKSLVLFLFVFSFDSWAMSWFRSEPQELQEIKIYGNYHPGGPEEIEDSERYYREHGRLEEGETLADIPRFAHKMKYLGKERFRTGRDWKPITYCYEKILDEDREKATVIDPNLRARMYDKEGNLLAEDTLRDGNPERKDPFLRSAVAYLPYLRNGDVILRIVRLEGDEEVILYEFLEIRSHETLKAHHWADRNSNIHIYGSGYKFYPKGARIRTSIDPTYRVPFSCYK
ncbi:MAG: hypothetical protein OXM55_00605 [Bdellovibrionales bacterium]|nr:hypothetical protein [Bdellovibrionales bacterium]